MLAAKRRARSAPSVVAGCLAGARRSGCSGEVPGVDSIVGVHGREVEAVVDRAVANRRSGGRSFASLPVKARLDTPGSTASRRGRYAHLSRDRRRLRAAPAPSAPSLACARQARDQADRAPILAEGEGARLRRRPRSLSLVAQDTTYYGLDLYGEGPVRQLLRGSTRWTASNGSASSTPIRSSASPTTSSPTRWSRAKKIVLTVSRYAAPAHQRSRPQADAAQGPPGRHRRSARPTSACACRSWSYRRPSSPASLARPTRSSRSSSSSSRSNEVQSGRRLPLFAGAGARQPSGLDGHLPEGSRTLAAIGAVPSRRG